MFKLRTSKYRHVFCDQPKVEQCYTDFKIATVTGEQQYIKASTKYWACAMFGGGGPFVVGRHDRPGRFEAGTSPIFSGHTGAVLDFEFSPFDDAFLATASEDTTIKLWQIPEDWEPTDANGMGKAGTNVTESAADLAGHTKKVQLLRFHPTSNHTLLSAAADQTVKVWDVESAASVVQYDGLTDLTQDIVWDVRGDSFAVSAKDKVLRLVDGRTGTEMAAVPKVHEGPKSVKIQFLGESGRLLTTGASKQSKREIKIWDLKKMDKPLHTEGVDTASGALIPLFDHDTNVLYLCGKGDGIIRLYEYEDKSPYIFKLNDGFRSTTPGKGYCLLPKRGLDIMGCETARILKMTNTAGVHPLSFIVPRKSDAFQEDIFPDAPSDVPAYNSCGEWMQGESIPPNRMSLNPDGTSSSAAATPAASDSGTSTPKKFKTATQLYKEMEEYQKRIEYLEGKLKEHNIAFEGDGGSADAAAAAAPAPAPAPTPAPEEPAVEEAAETPQE